MFGRGKEPTVEVLLEAAKGVHAVVLPHAHRKTCLVVVVYKALHQHLLVGPASPDLKSLQLQQFLKDAPLKVVPASVKVSVISS